jgi:hypothetical protein
VPSIAGEYYAVQTHDGQLKVFDVSGQELPTSEATLLELEAASESASESGRRSTIGVLKLRFRDP